MPLSHFGFWRSGLGSYPLDVWCFLITSKRGLESGFRGKHLQISVCWRLHTLEWRPEFIYGRSDMIQSDMFEHCATAAAKEPPGVACGSPWWHWISTLSGSVSENPSSLSQRLPGHPCESAEGTHGQSSRDSSALWRTARMLLRGSW